MNRIAVIVEWTVETILVAWLFWKASGRYVLFGFVGWPVLVFIVYVPIALIRWRALRKVAARNALFRLNFLTGLSVLLSLFLVARLTAELSLVPEPGWASKEMRAEAVKMHVPPESRSQFFLDEITRITSERNTYVVMSAILCLLYWQSYSKVLGQQQTA